MSVEVNQLNSQVPVSDPLDFPYAIVLGELIENFPEDLYIPPDAMEVFLESFTGPLDLLLYLIKKQNIDVLNLPVAEITAQYLQYIEAMKKMHLELAAEYLVMAAMLAEIKSKLLLPKPPEVLEEEDPRADLIRKLKEYQRYRQAAEAIDVLPRLEREIFLIYADNPEIKVEKPLPKLELAELIKVFKDLLVRVQDQPEYTVKREVLSVRQRMSEVLAKLKEKNFLAFTSLIDLAEGKMGVVVTFLAILELLRQQALVLMQNELAGKIYLQNVSEND
jgi:segregation and condensation protein A